MIERKDDSIDMFGKLYIRSYTVFDNERANKLLTQAEAYEARVADPLLKECISKLKQALGQANYNGRFIDGMGATAQAYSQKFYQRIAELYGDSSRAAAGPVAVEQAQPEVE